MEPKVLVTRIKKALERLAQLSAGVSDEALHADLALQESLLWNIQVVSAEAAAVPRTFQVLHPGVDWGALERMRAEIAPEYYSIEWPALLRAMHSTIPHLLAQVEGSLSNLD